MKEQKEAVVLDERDAKHPKYSYSFDADHQISPVDKTDEGVYLISDVAQLVSAADHVDAAGHETSTGTHAFHADHAAHGRNNEDQLNDALEKMNNLLTLCVEIFKLLEKSFEESFETLEERLQA